MLLHGNARGERAFCGGCPVCRHRANWKNGRKRVAGEPRDKTTLLINGLNQRVENCLHHIRHRLAAFFALLHKDIGDGGEAGDVNKQRDGLETAVEVALDKLLEYKLWNEISCHFLCKGKWRR